MYTPIEVPKGRTVTVSVNLGTDVSADTFVSEIRVDEDPESTLIAAWGITFLTDGTDGKLVLTLDNAVTSLIENSTGFMDIKRIINGEPVNVFNRPLPVVFGRTVTA